jgi:hypothetical protein
MHSSTPTETAKRKIVEPVLNQQSQNRPGTNATRWATLVASDALFTKILN